jgi:hypothetical protein
MFGFNDQVPGPIIKVKQGSTIFVNFTNNLDMDSSIHWHGLKLNNKYDGVPWLTHDCLSNESRVSFIGGNNLHSIMSEVWNKVYKSESTFFGEEAGNFALLCFNHIIVNNIRKVLDLGAGHGRDSIFFASNGVEVEALDYSAIAVEILGKVTKATIICYYAATAISRWLF